jgi:hypothetical protein
MGCQSVGVIALLRFVGAARDVLSHLLEFAGLRVGEASGAVVEDEAGCVHVGGLARLLHVGKADTAHTWFSR